MPEKSQHKRKPSKYLRNVYFCKRNSFILALFFSLNWKIKYFSEFIPKHDQKLLRSMSARKISFKAEKGEDLLNSIVQKELRTFIDEVKSKK